jgi:hypothetical protein
MDAEGPTAESGFRHGKLPNSSENIGFSGKKSNEWARKCTDRFQAIAINYMILKDKYEIP